MSLLVDGLYKRFGALEALRGVSFEVPRGSVFGLIGPNGAGKTTTMRAILRIVKPDAGRVAWDGRSVETVPLAAFGYLPEERGLYPRMRVREHLMFFGELYGMSRRRIAGALETLVALLRMQDIVDRRVEELSKGNAQKVQFAAACLHGPQLLVLDEPFSGLDPVNVRLFKAAVGHLRRQGSTILFSSHRMDHVEELCDGLCLIHQGQVVLRGGVEEVRRATGRRVLRLAWEGDGGAPDGWVDALRRQGFGVFVRGGACHVTWREGRAPSGELARALLKEAEGVAPVRLWELTYPSLEDVYVEMVGSEALEEGAA